MRWQLQKSEMQVFEITILKGNIMFQLKTKAWFIWSRLKHYWQYTKQLSFRRSRILWSCSFSTSFWRKILSFFSFRELSFSTLKARANALLFCFKDTFNIDELSIGDKIIAFYFQRLQFQALSICSLTT